MKPLSFPSLIPPKAPINVPPPDFDFRTTSVFPESRALISGAHPELLDLAENGALVVVPKSRFGPVPTWRAGFVEPETVWLIGTCHVAGRSADDVARVVKAVGPDSVVVELCRSSRHGPVRACSHVARVVRAVGPDNVVVTLCRSRAGIMYAPVDGDQDKPLKSNAFSLSGDGFFGAVGRSLNLGGQTALALRLLLAVFSSKISSDVNRPFGDEFRAARKAAEEVGAQVVLGDRPIEITLERAWNSLNLKEKLSLVAAVVRGITSKSDVSESSLKNSSTNDSPFQLYEQLSFSYPSLLMPLIHERDTYLAWSLKRSKAVNNGKRVVGVIGKGHLNGVIYALISDSGDLRFRDLAGYKTSGNSWIDGLVKNLVRDTVIAVILWELFEQFKPIV